MPPKKKAVLQEDIGEQETPAYCDNHALNQATLVTTSDGAHSEVHLCDECIPPWWRP